MRAEKIFAGSREKNVLNRRERFIYKTSNKAIDRGTDTFIKIMGGYTYGIKRI